MKPMGRKPIRFPGKTDCHPKPGWVNWWEVEYSHGENKKGERQQIKNDLRQFAKASVENVPGGIRKIESKI